MIKTCERCGVEYDGTAKSHYCKKCRAASTAANLETAWEALKEKKSKGTSREDMAALLQFKVEKADAKYIRVGIDLARAIIDALLK